LKCISVPGQGAEFLLEIPIKQSAKSQLPVSQVDTSLKNH
jgi:hypothetical protein